MIKRIFTKEIFKYFTFCDSSNLIEFPKLKKLITMKLRTLKKNHICCEITQYVIILCNILICNRYIQKSMKCKKLKKLCNGHYGHDIITIIIIFI